MSATIFVASAILVPASIGMITARGIMVGPVVIGVIVIGVVGMVRRLVPSAISGVGE